MRIVKAGLAIILVFTIILLDESERFKISLNKGTMKNMSTRKNITCTYNEEMGGVVANIIGNLDTNDIDDFSRNLLGTIEKYTPNNKFTLLLNGNGYMPRSIFVHQKYSSFLKSNKLLIAYCKAVGHVHHDSDHINDWKPFMNEYQGFFNTYDEAFAWLKARK